MFMQDGFVENLKYFGKRGSEFVGESGDSILIIAPHSDADERFGAGRTDEQATVIIGKFFIVI